MQIALGPGEEKIFSTQWDQTYQSGAPVPPGTYQVSVMINCGEPITPDVITIKIEEEQTLSLYEGWNFVSLPFDPVNTNLDYVLGPVLQDCISVWSYDNVERKWLKHIFDGSSFPDDLTTIEFGKGYLINMSGDATLTVAGKVIEQSYVILKRGWNLVGCNSMAGLSLDALNLIQYESISTYDNPGNEWVRYAPVGPPFMNNLGYLETGKAYWLYANKDCTWHINAPDI